MLIGRLPEWRTYWQGPRKKYGAESPDGNAFVSRTNSNGV
jgi:hypothetical protein